MSSARVAYLVLAHRGPDQVARLVRRLEHPDASFFVHVDRNADDAIAAELRAALPTATFVNRVGCTWGGFGIVRAALEGLRTIRTKGGDPDFVVLLSGQDYPVRRVAEIHAFLGENNAHSFVNHFSVPTENWANGGLERMTGWHWHGRVFGKHVMFPDPRFFAHTWHRRFPEGFTPYGGSMYWALSRAARAYLYEFIVNRPQFVRYFKHVNVPDESFFHTILMNSPLAPSIVDNDLHYADWSAVQSHPKTLGLDDLDAVFASGRLFARKFDDAAVLDAIDERVG